MVVGWGWAAWAVVHSDPEWDAVPPCQPTLQTCKPLQNDGRLVGGGLLKGRVRPPRRGLGMLEWGLGGGRWVGFLIESTRLPPSGSVCGAVV